MTLISGPRIPAMIASEIARSIRNRGAGCISMVFEIGRKRWEAVHSYEDVWGIIGPEGACSMVRVP